MMDDDVFATACIELFKKIGVPIFTDNDSLDKYDHKFSSR